MRKKMSSDNKKVLIFALLSLVVLVATIISVVWILAESQQTVQSNISVHYKVDGVGAKVIANYAIVPNDEFEEITKVTMMSDGNEIVEFGVGDEQSEREVSPVGKIAISSERKMVVFEYIFENTTISAFSLSLDTRPIADNMTESFYVSSTELDTTEYREKIVESTLKKQALVNQGDKIYIYVAADVINSNLSASYNGLFEWNLSRQDTILINLNNGDGTGGRSTLNIISTSKVEDIAMPVISTLPSKTGYKFVGYNTASNGTGTYYINENGTSAHTANLAEGTTLYAIYEEVPYILTNTSDGNALTATIENISEDDEKLYVSTLAGQTFSFGSAEYESNGEYIMVQPGQTVSVSENTGASAVSYADATAKLVSDQNIRIDTPSNLATKKFFAAYGEYPQTYVGNTLNTTLKSASLTATGKSYTTDINKTATTLTEYSYNGAKYAKLTSSNAYGSSNYVFKDGTTVSSSQTYFFKVEPIVAKAMEINGDKATMMTVEIMGSRAFDDNANNWQTSTIRTYLNNTFLTESGLSAVAQSTTIKNEDPFNTSSYDGDTTDKIWLASAREILEWTGSGGSYSSFVSNHSLSDSNDSKRKIKPSDIAMATYSNYDKTNDAGIYFLRSAGLYVSYVCSVGSDGYVSYGYNYLVNGVGFCPVFAINL